MEIAEIIMVANDSNIIAPRAARRLRYSCLFPGPPLSTVLLLVSWPSAVHGTPAVLLIILGWAVACLPLRRPRYSCCPADYSGVGGCSAVHGTPAVLLIILGWSVACLPLRRPRYTCCAAEYFFLQFFLWVNKALYKSLIYKPI